MSLLRSRLALVAAPLAAAVYLFSSYTDRGAADAPTSVLVAEKHTDLAESYTRRIVAVGDLHGDIGNAQQVLHLAGVVDEHGNWSGNVDFFVQTGDIIDRQVTRRAQCMVV